MNRTALRCTLGDKATLSGLALAKDPPIETLGDTEYAKARYIRSKHGVTLARGVWLCQHRAMTKGDTLAVTTLLAQPVTIVPL